MDDYEYTDESAVAAEECMIQQIGAEAVILYPSLGSPAVVAPGGALKLIILARDHGESIRRHNLFDLHLMEKDGREGPIGPLTAYKFHAQLRLFSWGGADAFYKYTDDYQQAYEVLNDTLLSRRYDIYKYVFDGYDSEKFRFVRNYESVSAFNRKLYRGWYLGELKQNEKGGIYLQTWEKDAEDDKSGEEKFSLKPFGILSSQAVDTYLEGKYKHIFQLHLGHIGQESKAVPEGMMEVMWLYLDREKRAKDYPENEGVCFNYVEIDEENERIMASRGLYHRDLHHELITAKMAALFAKEQGGDLFPSLQCIWDGLEPNKTIKSFVAPRLDSFEFSKDIPLAKDEKAKIDKLPAMDLTAEKIEKIKTALHGRNIIRPRHPVYFVKQDKGGKKELLKIGVLADTHLSVRDSLYRMSPAQVILGAAKEDSPFVGPMAHEALAAGRSLLHQIGKSEADIVIFAGDLYDYSRNLDPRRCAGEISKPADLWYFTDFNKRQSEAGLYPHYIDAMLGLSAIYDFYNTSGKPLFFTVGNHEGYENPFTISPRLQVPFMLDVNAAAPSPYHNDIREAIVEVMKFNHIIPAEHNLTYYEAALLFGPHYNDWSYSFLDFKAKNLAWLHLLVTPWQDIIVNYDEKQSFLMLGWGDNEDYIWSFLAGGDTLPRADQIITQDQLKLLQHLSQRPGLKTMCSHFTVINYNPEIPLIPGKEAKNPFGNRGGMVEPDITTDYNHGSFYKHYLAAMELIDKLDYAICGHAHRAGFYMLDSGKNFYWGQGHYSGPLRYTGKWLIPEGLNIEFENGQISRVHFSETAKKSTAVIVTGAGGAFSRQNVYGELSGQGMELPQGLILDPNRRSVKIKRVKGLKGVGGRELKPRLAVVLDLMWSQKKPLLNNIDIIPACHIYGGPGGHFVINPNQEVMKALGGFPLTLIKLHAVNLNSGLYLDSLQFQIDHTYNYGYDPLPDRKEKFLMLKAEDGIDDFIKKAESKIDTQQILLYFLSLHFNGKSDVKMGEYALPDQNLNQLLSNYDLDSPYVFPVKLRKADSHAPRFYLNMTTYWQNPDTPSPPRNYYIIYRPLVPWGDTGAGSEVPDFEVLKANPAYKARK